MTSPICFLSVGISFTTISQINGERYPEIFMRYEIPHSPHFFPANIGVVHFQVVGNINRRFADNFEVADNSVLFDPLLLKIIIAVPLAR